VHELAFHPANGEIVAATHGRSIWACDISALRQLSADHVKDKIALFKPAEVVRWQSEPLRGRTNRRFAGTNPAPGAQLWYALPKKAERVSLRVEDIEGRTVRELRGSTDIGLNRVAWDLLQTLAQPANATGTTSGQRGGRRGATGAAPPATQARSTGEGTQARSASEGPGSQQGQTSQATASQERQATPPPAAVGQRGGGTGGGRGGGPGGGRPAPNGTYRVVLVVDGRALPPQFVRLDRDPNAPASAVLEETFDLGDDDARWAVDNARRKRLDD
jgi:hypothetical protein